MNANLWECFQKFKEEETFPNSFNDANTTMIPKPDKGTTNILDEYLYENYKPIFLMIFI